MLTPVLSEGDKVPGVCRGLTIDYFPGGLGVCILDELYNT